MKSLGDSLDALFSSDQRIEELRQGSGVRNFQLEKIRNGPEGKMVFFFKGSENGKSVLLTAHGKWKADSLTLEAAYVEAAQG